MDSFHRTRWIQSIFVTGKHDWIQSLIGLTTIHHFVGSYVEILGADAMAAAFAMVVAVLDVLTVER